MHLKYAAISRFFLNNKPALRCVLASTSNCVILAYDASDASSEGLIGPVDPIALSISLLLKGSSLSVFFFEVKRLAAGENTLGGYELRHVECVAPG
jgi:hypothetical protein